MAKSAHERYFLHCIQNPKEVQERAFERQWRLIRNAPFWRAQFRGAAPRLGDFPITTYADYQGAIERSFSGSASELNGEPIEYWAKSSGTSSEPKLFPWTRSFLRQRNVGTRLSPKGLLDSQALWAQGRHLVISATNPEEQSPGGIAVGYASSYFEAQVRRRFPEAFFPTWISDNFELYQMWMPIFAVAADLKSMAATTAAQVSWLLRTIASRWAEIVEGIRAHDAGKGPQVSLERLEHLRNLASAKGPPSATEIWPRLRAVWVWRSSTAGLQAEELAETLGASVRIYDRAYLATEGAIALRLGQGGIGGPMHPGAGVFEFAEVGQPASQRNLLKLWELESGKGYEVFLTNRMGLVRYRLGDVVRCSGFLERVPVVHFERRCDRQLSLGLIIVTEADLEPAIRAAGLSVDGTWFVSPNQTGTGLVLITQRLLPPEAVRDFHEALMSHHAVYRQYVEEGVVHILTERRLNPEDEAWRRFGLTHGQSKPHCLAAEDVGVLSSSSR